jgi:TRAP-type C4-dicarboxylate transport system permease small subunit
MHRVKNWVDRTLAAVCIVLFAILVVIVSWQVLARQVLDQPSAWSETLSRYVFIWLGLLGSALVFGERGHIAIDILARRLPRNVQRPLAILVQLVVIGFSVAVLVWGGWRASMLAMGQNLSGLPTTIGPWYLVMPLAGVLIVLYSIYHLIALAADQEEPISGADLDAV